MKNLVITGYMIVGVILAFTFFLSVRKEINGIHMVFDATVSRIYDYLFNSNFMIPVMNILLMMVGT